jgi:hypothetical protein
VFLSLHSRQFVYFVGTEKSGAAAPHSKTSALSV